jgi:D-alanine-D-alanine ligase
MTEPKLTVAVFYGGRSPEHDVSVVSALQAMEAIDRKRFEVVPVYVDIEGKLWTGDLLFDRNNYLPDETVQKKLTELTLDLTPAHGTGLLVPLNGGGLFGGPKPIEFDVALPVVHGTTMEDGALQGLFEMIEVPYAGMRLPACTLAMDKVQTKHVCRSLDIPCLPFEVLQRPEQGLVIAEEVLKKQLKGFEFPAIVKPVHLGSSIGVAKVDSIGELSAVLPELFKFDNEAMLEPFVPNLVEYNVAVSAAYTDEITTSAIERPKSDKELLDFKEKYCSGGGKKTGEKAPGQLSEGMLSLTRELNPKLAKKLTDNVETWGKAIFSALGRTGVPRIDFLSNSKTGEIWLNEINPCPGSLGYFLWEAKEDPILFTAQLTAQIEEALAVAKQKRLPYDPVPEAARLLKRPGI